MNREQFRTPDEDIVEEFGRVIELFQQSIAKFPDHTLLVRLMSEASAKGLNWIEGLEYVAAHRGRTT